ncbi:hypothetical protein N665_0305s0021 [Sinapis alba]|nr:hypothetical protein N665_0305s0021 [Sinapis alba]
MAKLILIIASHILFLAARPGRSGLLAAVVSAGKGEDFAKVIDRKLLGLRKEKLTFFPNSNLVGQAQGMYAAHDASALMVMNFAFKTRKYNGSTISILGRNAVLTKVREMPVIGGSGLFRFARGYVEARTMWFDQKTGDATVEYSCYVLHY